MRFSNILFLVIVSIPVVVSGADFPRTLFLGMRGDDVRELQVFLNTDPETRVADRGVGSVGRETDFFGVATKRALIKFQEKYREEILSPTGLSVGTGRLGPKSKEKILSLAKGSKTSNTVFAKDAPLPVVEVVEKGKVVVMFPSQYTGPVGTQITVSGAGFIQKDNTVYFGADHFVSGVTSSNGQSLFVKVPDIPKGIYPLFVKNPRGESNKDAFFVVTDGVTPEPKIESVLPSPASAGDTVIVKGGGFLPAGNIMMVGGVGVFKNASSTDGATMRFVVPQNFFNNGTTSPKLKNFSIPVSVYIINGNGVSNAMPFLLKLQ